MMRVTIWILYIGVIAYILQFLLDQGTPSDHSSRKVHKSPTIRNFMTHPVSNKEHQWLTEQDAFLPNITAAVCHPAIWGERVAIDRFLAFVSYYRLLGFDHIFFWYENETLIWSPQDYARLQNLSYVTMTLHRRQAGKGAYHSQNDLAGACRSQQQFAGGYDYVLAVDADEFLWLENNATIKEFVSQQDYTYYSFGKWQYGTKVATVEKSRDSGFGLDRHGFTPGPYCYQSPGKEYCPDWFGRSKILSMNAKQTPDIPVHGSPSLLRLPTATHYDLHKAHIKEWPGIALLDAGVNATIRPAQDWELDLQGGNWIGVDDQIGVHSLAESFARTDNGTVLIRHDDNLIPWMRFLASRLLPYKKEEEEKKK